MHKLVVMGVAGSGKSTLAQQLARELGYRLIEGDEHHLPASKAKMRARIPLDDADRLPWLHNLGVLVANGPGGAVLSCSALKRSYRDRLRAYAPTIRFVFIEIEQAEAVQRVSARPRHSFPVSLVASQFSTLESPVGESGVLRVLARDSLRAQVDAVTAWVRQMNGGLA